MARQSHVDMKGKVKSLKANLDERYKEFFCIVQELLQNADDAKASSVIIGQLDKLSDKHELCNVPGIFVINNGPVSDSDLDHIFSIANSNKDDAEDKIGKFGLGMKSVFHLCEAFFIFGYQSSGVKKNTIVEFFDPWDNENHPEEMPPPHPAWRKNFTDAELKLWNDASKKLQKFHNYGTDWFALWLPLRQRNQCNGGKSALLGYYPLEENAEEWFTLDDYRKVSGMMPFFKHVRKISFVSGKLEHFGSLEMLPDNNSSFTGKSKNEWSGTIISDKQHLGKQNYHGWEFFGNKTLESLRQESSWPTTQFWDTAASEWIDQKDKTSPHAAICYCSEELSQNNGHLTLQECVFLPLSEMQQTLPLPLPCNVTISFHGQYFVDAGRRRYSIVDEKSSKDIKIHWNKELKSELLLPKVLSTFADFFKNWNVDDVKKILDSFTQSEFWKNNSAQICQKSQFLLCLSKNGWIWKREDANQRFMLLSDVQRPELLQEVFRRVNKSNLLVLADAPRLGTALPSPWPEDQICRLWDAAAAQEEKLRYDSVTLNFLESALNLIANPRNQQSNILKYLSGITMSQYRPAREQLGRILHNYPHCNITFAKDNWTTTSFELWKRILALASYCLPLDLPEDNTVTFSYTEADLQKMLPELEKSLAKENDANCRSVVRDLVCSIFKHNSVDWQSSSFAKYKLFVLQDKILSFADLQALHNTNRLFLQGGDVSTQKALQKAIKWGAETLPAHYSAALKVLLDVVAFNIKTHIPAIFNCRPDLLEPSGRIDLLKKLKSSDNLDLYLKVIRYLLHGNKNHYDYEQDIEIPAIPSKEKELFVIGSKLLYVINTGKPQFEIPSELIEVFSEIEMENCGICKLRFEDIFRKINGLSETELEHVCQSWRTQSSWLCLTKYLNSKEDLQLLAELPIWYCKNSKYTALNNNCFLEDEIAIPGCVRGLINQLDISDWEQIQILKDKFSSDQLKVWDDYCTVDYCTRLPWSKQNAEEILEAFDEHSEEWSRPYLDKLFEYPLFETHSGRWISYMQITKLFSLQSAGLYPVSTLTSSSVERIKKLSDFGAPDKIKWTDALSALLSGSQDSAWGNLPEDLCSADKFRELFTDNTVMPILQLFDELEDCIDPDKILRDAQVNVSSKRLESICTYISTRYEQTGNPLFMNFLSSYIKQARNSAVDWTQISLPNALQKVCRCDLLVRQADSADPQYVLHPKLQNLFDNSAMVVRNGNALPCFNDSANLSLEKYIALTSKAGTVLDQYFSPWPDELYPAIGAFMLLAGNNATVPAHAKKFTNREQKQIWEKISEQFAADVQGYNLGVEIFEGNFLTMTSLAGTKLSVPLQDHSELENLLIGEDCYNCRLVGNYQSGQKFIFLALRPVAADKLNRDTGLQLLINTAKKLVDRFGASQDKNKVPELFEEMKATEQFDLQTTKSVILKGLPFILYQMNLSRDSVLKKFLREWDQNNKYKTQAEEDGKKDLTQYDRKFQELHDELRDLFENYESVREETLSAIRRRISTAEYGYDVSSIPFELFQNADDAAAELQMMQGIPETEKEVVQRFVIELTEGALNVIHWGRPINQYQYPGFDYESGRKSGFEDDLRKMLLMGMSDKSDDIITRTGKFGLGFKSIFLLTDQPLIGSNRLFFSVQGGLLPKLANPDEKNILQSIINKYKIADRIPTVFHLPFRNAETFDLKKFKSAAPLLVRFSRKINEIRIVDQREDITYHSNYDDNYEVWNLGDAQIAIGKCDGLPAPLPKENPATIWVTSPTQIAKKMGFAVNGNFNVDVGRNQLLAAPENAQIAKKSAECLFELLTESVENQTTQYWKNLWDLFSNREDSGTWSILNTDKATAQVLKELFWGSRENPAGYGKFLQHHKVLPTGLPGRYEALTSVEQIGYAADEELSMYWSLFEGFAIQQEILPGKIVGQKIAKSLENIYSVNYLAHFSLSQLLQESADKNPNLSPSMINSKKWSNFKAQMGTIYQDSCKKFCFLNRKGNYCSARELLIPGDNNKEESCRAGFAPDEALISDKYDKEALEFFRYVRNEMNVSVEQLAQWAYDAKTATQRDAVCHYLNFGNLQQQVASLLRKKLKTVAKHWLHLRYDSDPTDPGLRKLFIDELKSLSEWEALFALLSENNAENNADDNEDDDFSYFDDESILVNWKSVAEQWKKQKDAIIRSTNLEFYGTEDLLPFPLTLDTLEDRNRWMTLFVLAASQSLGRQNLYQHLGFIQSCREKKYWDIFIAEEIHKEDWIDIIDAHIEANDKQYGYWLSLYPSIYMFAKYMDAYVEFFDQLTYDDHPVANWLNLTCYRNNSNFNGTDFTMPDLRMGLGNIGIHFFLRELWRSNTLRPAGMEKLCFGISRRNRQLFNLHLSSGGNQESNGEWSIEMYDVLSQYLDDPTFDGQFDVAFECIRGKNS